MGPQLCMFDFFQLANLKLLHLMDQAEFPRLSILKIEFKSK